MKTKLTLILALFALIPALALAAPGASDIRRVENYLQNLTTLQADFIQTAHNGQQMTGTFYLSRPGRLRFEYDHSDDFIVADGIFIYYYDSELRQQSNTTIGNSLADFLLRRNISLDGDINVANIQRDGEYLHVTINLADDPAAGVLILTVTDNPMELVKWQVIDSQNLRTDIRLRNVETGIRINRNLFYYVDPVRPGSTYN